MIKKTFFILCSTFNLSTIPMENIIHQEHSNPINNSSNYDLKELANCADVIIKLKECARETKSKRVAADIATALMRPKATSCKKIKKNLRSKNIMDSKGNISEDKKRIIFLALKHPAIALDLAAESVLLWKTEQK